MTAQALAVAVRWLYFITTSLVVGVFSLLAIVARPAARRAGPQAEAALGSLDRRLVALARWAVAAALVSALLDLWRQTAVATGLGPGASLAPSALASVLLATRYGTVWLARQGLLVLAGGLLALAGAPRDGRDGRVLRLEAGGLAALSLALIAAAGHAASAQRVPVVAIVVDAVHLLATGVWFGALVPLAALLQWARARPGPDGLVVAAQAIRRFSRIGVAAVGLLVVTGVFSAWEQVGSFPALFGTPYGRWLTLKLALLLPLLAVAAVNHLVLKPRLDRAAGTGAMQRGRATVRRLVATVATESLLGAAIVGVVGVLGLSTPARHDQVAWPFAVRVSWDATRSLPGVQTRVAVGSQLALLGLVALCLAVIFHPRRERWIAGAATGAIAVGLLMALPPLAVDAYPTTYLRPTVPYAAETIAEGGEVYRGNCARCHGEHGYGDGPVARGLRPPPADLTAKHAADHTAGDMFWWLTHGIPGSAMPAFGDRLSVDQRWEAITFVRALADAERARTLGPRAEPRPRLVAPDFGYTPGVGEPRSLKDARGDRLVVLVLFTLPGSAERLSRLDAACPGLRRAGADVIAVPLGDARQAYRALGGRLVFLPIAVDGAAEAASTYSLFRPDPEAPPSSHLEFLVDRQGYLRARWAPEEGGGWSDPARLVAEVERLAAEPPVAAAPDEHVH